MKRNVSERRKIGSVESDKIIYGFELKFHSPYTFLRRTHSSLCIPFYN